MEGTTLCSGLNIKPPTFSKGRYARTLYNDSEQKIVWTVANDSKDCLQMIYSWKHSSKAKWMSLHQKVYCAKPCRQIADHGATKVLSLGLAHKSFQFCLSCYSFKQGEDRWQL
ncbi:985_t:CDS:2 [Entrophospora sp. SA101]|nr:985_t:CDS:2 [Entrophospora sp. SA101]